jgi:DNA-binding Lrp family transcriptional regulator
VVLIELEHRFTGPEIDWFYRSIEDLSKDSGLSRPTVIKGLKTLNAIGLIETFQEHFNNRDTGKRSEKHIAVITIL